eukprot:TRINITY_DN5943_c0_g1_i1.p1 TRINITY_DN5943_c0_g1~~TRINITY_DN5943_c0_g1_i1.p1  ORF type:complete len:531 (-),score=98.59 TRINITY_DN5943_c0_g1_i1:27-1619(-)
MDLKLISVAWIFLLGAVGADPSSNYTLINTQNGAVQGFVEDGARLFLGIPFGESTAGENRWSAPIPKQPWKPETIQATSFKPACPQQCVLPEYLCPNNTSEDCLNLNVYAPIPSNGNSGPWPVMVFIYGGAFFQGTSMVEIYSGKYMAANADVVVVTGDYRVGVLGFLVTDQLGGNFGIMDQRLMLQWVQDNIADFGGDPTQVTLFGESAGAMSTSIHWTSPSSWPFFKAVIMESDPFSIYMPTVQQAQEVGKKFAYETGCDYDDTTCMRNVDVDQVVNIGQNVWALPDVFNFSLEIALVWQPVVDGSFITGQIFDSVAAGNYHKVPVMMGSNQDEGIMFAFQVTDYLDDVEYVALITGIYGEDAYDVIEEYPVTDDPLTNIIDPLSSLLTDYLFACSTRFVADSIASDTPFYLYHYDHILSFSQSWGPNFSFCMNKSCHGGELPFVFHSATDSGFNYTPEELILTDQMVLYWTNFAKTGNPNSGNAVQVQWPQYSSSTRQNILLATPISQEENYNFEYCNFWDGLGYGF